MSTFFRLRTFHHILLRWLLVCILVYAGNTVSAQSEISVAGNAYLSLSSIASKLGMKHTWIDSTGSDKHVRLSSDWTRMDFTLHKREMRLNGLKVFLGNPVAEKGNNLYISERDFQVTISPVLTPQIFNPVPTLSHIVIDAGHGGKDPGTQNTSLKLQEKHLVLDLSRRLKKLLENHGYRVSLIREKDVYIAPAERANLANRMGADLFLSLHFNATVSSSVTGIETYTFTPPFQPSTSRSSLNNSDRKRYPSNQFDAWSTLLGFYVQREMLEELKGADRGLKRARFAALRDLNCPGILIEGGFLSNTREAKNIGWSAYRQRLAASIAEGVLTYQKTLDRLLSRGGS